APRPQIPPRPARTRHCAGRRPPPVRDADPPSAAPASPGPRSASMYLCWKGSSPSKTTGNRDAAGPSSLAAKAAAPAATGWRLFLRWPGFGAPNRQQLHRGWVGFQGAADSELLASLDANDAWVR